MTQYDELAKRLHPSAINLAAIPGMSSGYDRHMAIRHSLLRLAQDMDGELRGVVSQWRTYRDTTPQPTRSMQERKAVYDGLNCAVGVLQREWERNGFAGAVLAIMPPTDGYDDNGNERQGIADYATLIEQDVPY